MATKAELETKIHKLEVRSKDFRDELEERHKQIAHLKDERYHIRIDQHRIKLNDAEKIAEAKGKRDRKAEELGRLANLIMCEQHRLTNALENNQPLRAQHCEIVLSTLRAIKLNLGGL